MSLLKGTYRDDYFDVHDRYRCIKLFGDPSTAWAPSMINLQGHDGSGTRTNFWFFPTTAGQLRMSTSEPTSDASGSAVGSGVSGATTALDNIASVAIPDAGHLLPLTDNTPTLGDATHSFSSAYLGTSLVFVESTYDLTVLAANQTAAARNATIQDLTAHDTFAMLAETQTLTNKTLTAPKFADGGFLADDSGAELLEFGKTASAINHIKITNKASTNDPVIEAKSSTNAAQGIVLTPKGTGEIHIADDRLTFDIGSGVKLIAATPTGAQEYTMPDAGGNDNFVFQALAQTLTNKTHTSPIFTSATTMTLKQVTADYTLSWDNPGAGRAISISDPGGTDVFAWVDATQTLTSKTIAGASNTLTVRGEDISLSSETTGDVMYYDGSDWVRLAKGVNGQYLQIGATIPNWATVSVGSTDTILSPFTVEGGTHDPVTTVTAQSTGAAALTIPDLDNVAQEWVFSKQAQTLTNKTITTLLIATTDYIADAGGNAYLTFVEDSTPRDSFQITTGDAGLGAKLEVITDDTNANMILDAAGAGDIQIANGTELSFLRTTQPAHIVVTDQTGEAHTFTVPDIATTASDTFAFLLEAQTLAAKTLTAPKIVTTDGIADAAGAFYLKFVEDATPVDYLQITSADAGVHPKLEATGATAAVNLELDAKGTGVIWIKDNTDITFERAAQDALLVVADQTGEDHTFNIPDIATNNSDTFAFLAEAQTFTNKTYDANGTGNVLTNVCEAEVENIDCTNATYTLPVVICAINTGAVDNDVFTGNVPFKFRVLDAWAVSTKANSGTWKLQDGTNDITTTVSYGADTLVSRAAAIDDAHHDIPTTDDLHVLNSDGTDTAIIYIQVLPLS